MKLSFEYGGLKISYNLAYKKTHVISIHVENDGQVNVVAPIGTKVMTVVDKIKGNAPWIIRELQKMGRLNQTRQLKEQYSYLGKSYGVEVVEDSSLDSITVKLVRGKFVIQAPSKNDAEMRTALINWYKDKLDVKIKERLKIYEHMFDVKQGNVSVMNLRNALLRVSDNDVMLDISVAMLPVDVIDYVIVSALCNINYKNNPDQFNEKLLSILPNYKDSMTWIEENRALLII